MIVPFITAIWFGVMARKAKRNSFLWGLAGALLVFVVTSIAVNLGLLAIRAADGRTSFEQYVAIRIVLSALGFFFTIFLGRKLIRRKPDTKLIARSLPLSPSASLPCDSISETLADGLPPVGAAEKPVRVQSKKDHRLL